MGIEDVVTKLFTGSYALSPRGHKKDYTETAARNFECDGSFIGLDGHEYLQGQDWKDRQLEILVRDGFKCRICQSEKKPFDVHHIIPRGSGGSEDWDNLMLICRTCHNALHPEKHLRWTGGGYVE